MEDLKINQLLNDQIASIEYQNNLTKLQNF